MEENIETKDVQRTEYLDKNGLDMLWAKVKENTHNQVEVERNRAKTQENIIIETKADKSELHSSYVSNSTFTALQEKVAANTDAIRDKQDAGNYLFYKTLNNEGYYEIPDIRIPDSGGITKTDIDSQSISVNCDYPASHTTITCDGISNTDNNANHVYATDGSIADLTQYAKKTDIPEVDTSNFVSKTATNITTGGFGQIRTVDTINNNIGVGNNTSSLAYIGEGELGVIGYRNGYAIESFRYTTTYGLETINNSGYKGVRIPCDSNKVVIYKSGTNNYNTSYGYSGITLGENADYNNLLNTNGSYKTIGTDITPLENGKVPTKYLTAATKESLGVVKVGDGLNVTDGTISVDSTAIGAGNYIPYNKATNVFYYLYNVGIISQKEDGSNKTIQSPAFFEQSDENHSVTIRNGYINISNTAGNIMTLNNDDKDGGIVIYKHLNNSIEESLRILEDGIRLMGGDNNHVLTSNASTIDITKYALKSVYDEKIAALEARIATLEAKHTETA